MYILIIKGTIAVGLFCLDEFDNNFLKTILLGEKFLYASESWFLLGIFRIVVQESLYYLLKAQVVETKQASSTINVICCEYELEQMI